MVFLLEMMCTNGGLRISPFGLWATSAKFIPLGQSCAVLLSIVPMTPCCGAVNCCAEGVQATNGTCFDAQCHTKTGF